MIGRVDWRSCSWTVIAPPGSTTLPTPQIPLTGSACETWSGASAIRAGIVASDIIADYTSAKRNWRTLESHLYKWDYLLANMRVPLPDDGYLRIAGSAVE